MNFYMSWKTTKFILPVSLPHLLCHGGLEGNPRYLQSIPGTRAEKHMTDITVQGKITEFNRCQTACPALVGLPTHSFSRGPGGPSPQVFRRDIFTKCSPQFVPPFQITSACVRKKFTSTLYRCQI